MIERRLNTLSGLALAAVALATPAAGQQPETQPVAEPEPTPRYRVEFIIFEHTDADPETERLPVASSLPQAATGSVLPERRRPFGVEPQIGEFGEPVFTDRPGPQQGDDTPEPLGPGPRPGDGEPALEPGPADTPESETGAAGVPSARETPGQAAAPGALPGSGRDAAADGGPKIELFGPPEFQQRRVERWFEPLPADALELTAARRQLERTGAYRVLAHAGWEQDATSEPQARPLSLAELGIGNPSGTLTMYVSRYVHLIADLRYRSDALGTRALGTEPAVGRTPDDAEEPGSGAFGDEPEPGIFGDEAGSGIFGDEAEPGALGERRAPGRGPSRAPGESGAGAGFPSRGVARLPAVSPIHTAPTYLLNAQRRARTDELHYIDHPLFGILVRVTEAPEEEPEESEAADGELAPAA